MKNYHRHILTFLYVTSPANSQTRVNKIKDETSRQENIYSADINSENQNIKYITSEIPTNILSKNTNSNFHIQFFIKTSSIKLEFQESSIQKPQFHESSLPAYHLQVPNPLKPKNNDNTSNTSRNLNQETIQNSHFHPSFFKFSLQKPDSATIKSCFSPDLVIDIGERARHTKIFEFHHHEFDPRKHLWTDNTDANTFCTITRNSILYCDFYGIYHIQKHNETHHTFYTKSVFNSKHSKPLVQLENVEKHKLSKRDVDLESGFDAETGGKPGNTENSVFDTPQFSMNPTKPQPETNKIIDEAVLSSVSLSKSGPVPSATAPRPPPCTDCVCSLAIYVDTEFFKNYGESDVQKTYGLVVSAIHALNQYYNKQVRKPDLKKFNQGKLSQSEANKNFWKSSLGIQSLQFQLKYLKIHEEYTEFKNGESSGVFYNFKEKPTRNGGNSGGGGGGAFSEFESGFNGFPGGGGGAGGFTGTSSWTPYAKLTYFAKSHAKGEHNHGKYCLSHLFTYHDFENGTIGLAFLANVAKMLVGAGGSTSDLTDSDEHSQSGICAKPKRDESNPSFHYDYYQNTALTTFKNYGVNVATAEAHLVTAHEIGHNLGAAHDCSFKRTGQGQCEQVFTKCMGDSKNGDWLMAEHAVSGEKPNNHRFSGCSEGFIRKVTYGKIFNCLKGKDEEPLCGNFIVESSTNRQEQCDVGMVQSKEECCDVKTCNLKPGKECSPRNDVCCSENGCKLLTALDQKVCNDTMECYKPIFCNGSKSCPILQKYQLEEKEEGTVCSGNRKCKGGICMSQCEFYDKGQTCFCEDQKDACNLCCQKNSSECQVLAPTTKTNIPLFKGSTCKLKKAENSTIENISWMYGICLEKQIKTSTTTPNSKVPDNKNTNSLETATSPETILTCQRNEFRAATIDSIFSSLFDHISNDGFLKFVGRNFVGAIIMFSLLIWAPLAYLFHAADQKQVEIHARQNLAFEGMATFMMMHTVGMLQTAGGTGEDGVEKEENNGNELILHNDKNVNDQLYGKDYQNGYHSKETHPYDGYDDDMAGGIEMDGIGLDEKTIEPTNVENFGVGDDIEEEYLHGWE